MKKTKRQEPKARKTHFEGYTKSDFSAILGTADSRDRTPKSSVLGCSPIRKPPFDDSPTLEIDAKNISQNGHVKIDDLINRDLLDIKNQQHHNTRPSQQFHNQLRTAQTIEKKEQEDMPFGGPARQSLALYNTITMPAHKLKAPNTVTHTREQSVASS